MISQKLLNELKNILKEDYGVVVNGFELQEIGMVLIRYHDFFLKVKQKQTRQKNEKPKRT